MTKPFESQNSHDNARSPTGPQQEAEKSGKWLESIVFNRSVENVYISFPTATMFHIFLYHFPFVGLRRQRAVTRITIHPDFTTCVFGNVHQILRSWFGILFIIRVEGDCHGTPADKACLLADKVTSRVWFVWLPSLMLMVLNPITFKFMSLLPLVIWINFI